MLQSYPETKLKRKKKEEVGLVRTQSPNDDNGLPKLFVVGSVVINEVREVQRLDKIRAVLY